MLSRKELIIQAHRELEKQHGEGTWIKNRAKYCPLCQVVDCNNCSLYDHSRFSKEIVSEDLHSVLSCNDMKTYDTPLRAEFHRRAVKILEQLPEYRFYLDCETLNIPMFPELWELDRKLAKKLK